MAFKVLYWHWLVLGMVLIMAELFVPSFTIFWFGLGAVVLGGLLLLMPTLGFSWQLFLWAVASCVFTFLWFRWLKPMMGDRTQAGISREAALGQSGLVVDVPVEGKRGTVRFTTPLLGAEDWSFICDAEVNTGDRVFVRDVSGNTLIVGKKASP